MSFPALVHHASQVLFAGGELIVQWNFIAPGQFLAQDKSRFPAPGFAWSLCVWDSHRVLLTMRVHHYPCDVLCSEKSTVGCKHGKHAEALRDVALMAISELDWNSSATLLAT